MGVATTIKSFFKVFTDESYTYVVDLPMHVVESKLKKLLDHGGFWAVPNIIGEVKGKKFSARQRRVLLYRNSPIHDLEGNIKKIESGIAIHIIMRADFIETLFFIIAASASLILILTAVALPESIIKECSILGQILIGAILLPISLIFWGMLSSRKRQLRQTFEDSMGIKPIDTHSM